MRLTTAILAISALPMAVSAHHSTAAFYDRGSTVEVEGVVTAASWRNPHVGLTLIVENEQGATEEWELEGGAMNTFLRRGVTDETIAIGDRVRVAGSPARGGQRAIFVSHFLLSNGQEYMVSDRPQPPRWIVDQQTPVDASAAAAQNPGSGIFRVWSEGEAYRLRAPLSLTPAAQAANDSWDPLTDDPALRCEEPGMPNAILNPYPIEFVDEGDRIVLKIEEWDAVRVIHLSGGVGPQSATPSRQGYSVGRWEGRTLFVETSRVNAPFLDGSGTPQSEDVEMVERFSLSEDESRLDYEIVITDPQNLVEPAVWEGAWAWVPGADVKPFECTLRQ